MSDVGAGPVTVRLAVRAVPARPGRWLTGVVVAAGAVALGGWTGHGPPLGVVLALVLGVSLAGAPDPDDLRTDAVFHLVGARRCHRYGLVVWSALVVFLPGLFLGLTLCAVATALVGSLALPSGWFLVAMLGAGVAVTPLAAQRRLRAQATTIRLGPPRQAVVAIAIDAGLLVVGIVLIWAAAWAPRTARTGFDLTLGLFFGYVGIGLGLLMVMPVLARAPRWLLSRLPLPPSRMAAGRPLPGLGLAMWLVVMGTVVATSASIVGFGLVARERTRQVALHRFDLRDGTADDQLIIRSSFDLFVQQSVALSPSTVDALHQAPAGSSAVAVGVPVEVSAGRSSGNDDIATPALRVISGGLGEVGEDSVGVATPELLAALRLRDAQPFLDRGGAVVLDPTRIENGAITVRTVRTLSPLADDERATGGTTAGTAKPTGDGGPARTFHLPARAVTGQRVASALPAALVSPAVAARMSSAPVRPLVAIVQGPGLDANTSEELSSRVQQGAGTSSSTASLVSVDITGGGDRLDPRQISRTDAPDVALVRDEPSLITMLIAGLLTYAVVVLVANRFVALSRRQEDEMYEVLGAPPSLVPRIAAVQAGALAVVAVLAGSVIGFVGTASGIDAYNHSTRLSRSGPSLPVIPFAIPLPLIVGLVLLPMLSASAAALAALRRPPIDPTLLGERLGSDLNR